MGLVSSLWRRSHRCTYLPTPGHGSLHLPNLCMSVIPPSWFLEPSLACRLGDGFKSKLRGGRSLFTFGCILIPTLSSWAWRWHHPVWWCLPAFLCWGRLFNLVARGCSRPELLRVEPDALEADGTGHLQVQDSLPHLPSHSSCLERAWVSLRDRGGLGMGTNCPLTHPRPVSRSGLAEGQGNRGLPVCVV